jgi:hypothetical protein
MSVCCPYLSVGVNYASLAVDKTSDGVVPLVVVGIIGAMTLVLS